MVALHALPSACMGRTLNDALDLVLEALPTALDCTLVLIDMPGPQRRREAVWCGARVSSTRVGEIDAAVASAGASDVLVYASNPLHWLEAALPVGKEYGRILVARRAPFEEDTDRVLVQSAANLAGTALGSASVLEAARRKDEFIATLLDAVTDYAIFMLDVTGHVATWNAGAKALKGYEPQEIIGKHLSIFYTDQDRKAGRPEATLKAVQRDGRVEDESWRVRKDGSRFWANVVVTALRDRKSAITGFVKVTRDLTQRRAAEENARTLLSEQLARAVSDNERRRLLTLLEQVPAIVNFLRGPDLVFEFAHPKAVELTGGRELIGKPLLVAIPEHRDQPFHGRLRHVLETGESFRQHDALAWFERDGQRVESYWDSVYLPVRDSTGAIEGVMTFDLEVTEGVLARRALERVSRAKDEFLATVSHELRTPLNAMLGWSTILKQKPCDEAKLARGLEVIERNARAQERLINDLMDVSRIISGKLQLTLRLVEISGVVHAAADVVRHAAEAKRVRLVVDLDPDVGTNVGDPDRLQQVVWNLLSNAIRFTPAGGRVHVTGQRSVTGICIRIEDTGAGIPSEHLPYIFDRFRQVDSSTTRCHGGLGLGLAIVRHLVEAHGGSVEAKSEGPDRGATFTIKLPIRAIVDATPAPGSVPEEAAPATPTIGESRETFLRDVRVLVVDDDPDSLELIGVALGGAGAKVTAVPSAREALAAPGPFDVILSDVGMPEMDGYAFVRRVRARDTGADIPAIALTAYARAEDAERALRAGYQEHFAKPVDAGKLLEAVKLWSRARSAAI
ncbi:MAG TPA: ATP-binding protein [Polyangiaceae bacterium]|nr:ATP-binding protein [Polyangiaceae bacterium]